ncbi:hypothetical protein Tco_1384820 [Tanacetum coccineum]
MTQSDKTSSNAKNKAIVQSGRVVVQDVRGRFNANDQGRTFQGNNARGHIARQYPQPKRPQNSDYFKDKMLLMQAQENGVVLDEEQLLFLIGEQTNTFDDDVDEPHVQDLALNVDHVFEADLFYDDAGQSYYSDILSEVQNHDNYQDSIGEHHEVHEMQNDVQQNYVVDSDTEYTNDGNIISYEQYEEDNTERVVQSDVSSVPNDTSELATYKELVVVYEKRARFELTKREQKNDEQLRMIITDRNIQETSLKTEIHSVKMQLRSTINHSKSMKEEVATLKNDFKQKEDQHLEDFLDMKQLKEKVEDKLFKQDQSVQTVHKLCKPKPFYDEKKKVAIGYKNPLYLTRVKQVQSALYNSHEIVKTNHAPAVVHDSEDTLEIAKITRKIMLEKVKSPLFSAMPDPYTVEQARVVKLEAGLSKLKHKIKTDCQDSTDFDTVFTIKKMKAQLQEKTNTIRELKVQISIMTRKRSEADLIIDFRALDSQNKELAEHVTALQNHNASFKVENEKVKQHYKELYDSIKITRANSNDKISSLLTEIENLKAQLKGKMKCVTIDSVTPKVLARGMYAIDVEPLSPRLRYNRDAHLDYLRHLKKSVETVQEILEEARLENPLDNVVQIVLWYLDSGCSKHMTGNRSRLKNFLKKFIGTIKFGNDRIGAIIGYGDYVIGDSVISRVHYVEELGHNLFSVGQFCDSNLKVAFRKHSCFVRDMDGVKLLKGSRATNLYTISIDEMMKSSPICLMSKASKSKSWLWHRRLGPKQNLLTPGQISSGFVPNSVPATTYVPPTDKYLEILFQPMFDEYLEPARANRQAHPATANPVPVVLGGTLFLTTIDQDAPFISHSPSSSEVHLHISHQSIACGPIIEENPFTHADYNPLINMLTPEPGSATSSTWDVSLTE